MWRRCVEEVRQESTAYDQEDETMDEIKTDTAQKTKQTKQVATGGQTEDETADRIGDHTVGPNLIYARGG